MVVPVDAPEPPGPSGIVCSYIPVQEVDLGSPAAAAVASAHLRSAIGRITIAGLAINPDSVQSKADAGKSEQ